MLEAVLVFHGCALLTWAALWLLDRYLRRHAEVPAAPVTPVPRASVTATPPAIGPGYGGVIAILGRRAPVLAWQLEVDTRTRMRDVGSWPERHRVARLGEHTLACQVAEEDVEPFRDRLGCTVLARLRAGPRTVSVCGFLSRIRGDVDTGRYDLEIKASGRVLVAETPTGPILPRDEYPEADFRPLLPMDDGPKDVSNFAEGRRAIRRGGS